MLKKCLSGILALSLSATLLPMKVLAGGSISIKNINATTTAVIVDFEGLGEGACPDETTVRDNVILEKHSSDGKITRVTNYTLTVQDKEIKGKDSKNKSAVLNKTNSVTIKPKEGVFENAIYRVVVKNGFSDTAGNTAIGETSEWFGVDVLFSDDFNADGQFDFAEQTAEYPYYWDETGTYLLTKYWNIQSAQRMHIGNITRDNNYKEYGVLGWYTNDTHASLTEEALPTGERVSDYTVEYKYQYPGYANNGSHTMNIRATATANSPGYNYNTGYRIMLRNGVASSSNMTAPIKFYSGSRILATTDDYTPSDSLIDVRFSAIGNNIQYSIDDDKIIDLDDSTYTAAGTVGIMDKNSTTYWAPSYIDDFVMSRVVYYGMEIPEISVENISINEATFLIEMSEAPVFETLSEFVELKGENGEIDVEIDLDGKVISVIPCEALADGSYVLTVKSGLSSANSAVLKDAYQIAFDVTDGAVTKKDFEKPEIDDIEIDILDTVFSMTYSYNGEGENVSKYIIYSSDEADGAFEEIKSGKLSGDELVFEADEKYVDKYIKVKIMPEDSLGYLNGEFETDVVKGMFTPVIDSAEIDDNFEEGSVEILSYNFFDENGDEDLSEIMWYASDSHDGKYEPIKGATGREIIIDETLTDKFVKAYITPKTDTYPYEGEVYVSDYYCRTYEPEAKNVQIIGDAVIGTTLQCVYEYFDKNATEESGSTAKWLISDSLDGEYEILGEEMEVMSGYAIEFTITQEHVGKYLKFEVIPRKEGVEGKPVTSEAFVMPKKPEAKNVTVSGTVKVGYTVSGAYEYYSESGAKEGVSLFKWYIDNEVVSEDINYTIKSSDAGKKLYFEVTPISETEPKSGDAKKSEGITVEKIKKPSGGGSSGGGGSYSGGIGTGTIINNIQQNLDKVQENPAVLLTNFTDIEESDYKKEIVELTDKGFIKGMTETEFGPVRNITRAEFVTLMVRILGLAPVEYEAIFTDISADAWYTENVLTAYKAGLIEGYAGLFRPDDGIKSEEILKILVETYEKKKGEIIFAEETFKNTSDWAVIYAQKAMEIGLISDDKEFILNEKALREDAAALIYRLLEEVEK